LYTRASADDASRRLLIRDLRAFRVRGTARN
jgi:hypothetical protein